MAEAVPTAEQRIDGERVYDGKVIAVDLDRVRLADGGTTEREVVRHAGAAVVVPLTSDGHVLMVRQYRYAAQEALLELPAGTLDAGEDPETCARRELAEEAGAEAERWRELLTFYSSPGFCDERLTCYLAEQARCTAKAQPDAEEALALVKLPWTEALGMARRGEFRDAKTVVGLLTAAAVLEAAS